jgi:peroxiredoxin
MRLTLGSPAPDFSAESIGGRGVSLEQLRGRPLLLKFYRFATCPVCNLHMHRFIMEHRMVSEAGLTTVVLYHSPADKLAEAQDYATPFDLIPDPEKRIFRAYGVERGLRGLVSPTVMREYFKALMAGFPPGLLTSDGGITGNPADFIIDASGRVVFAHYGKQYADSLEAADVVEAWRSVQGKEPTPNAHPVIRAQRGIADVPKEPPATSLRTSLNAAPCALLRRPSDPVETAVRLVPHTRPNDPRTTSAPLGRHHQFL